MNILEILLKELHYKQYEGNNTFEIFSQFYKTDGSRVKYVLDKIFQYKVSTKNNCESNELRKEGNKHYIKGQWNRSLECYTEAVSKAHDESESYSLALANRSAALCALKEYKYALQDIERCLLSNYPDKLKYKLYMRQISCYYKLGQKNEAENRLKESLSFIENNTVFTIQEKHFYKNKILDVENKLPDNTVTLKRCQWERPNVIENEKFPGASSLIGLRYTTDKGRYVVAEQNINTGDILFIEKAFAFAPIFGETSKLSLERCYYCLIKNKALIPCRCCSICLYCNDSCRTNSWNESHKWECNGMHVNFWSGIGLGFPAFRVLLKGIPSIKVTDDNGYNVSVHESENYKFAYNLVSNISKNNLLEFLILAAVVVTYLDTQTSFFEWLSDQMNMEDKEDLRIFFGSLLLRHAAQIACNASVIEQWDDDNYEYVPQKKIPIAVGLYPSVSMMNHSCISNISLYYINDIVIVKAITPIKQNEEIFNCYGVDYVTTSKTERKSALETRYHFQCLCRICANPEMEIDYLNAFKCSYCTGTVLEQNKCNDCGQNVDIVKILQLEDTAKQCLGKANPCLEDVNKCYVIMKEIYNHFNINLAECFDTYKKVYMNEEMFDQAIKYFTKSLEIMEKHWGKNSLNITIKILQFLADLRVCQMKNSHKRFSEDVRNTIKILYRQTVNMFPLHFPDNLIHYSKIKAALKPLVHE